MATASPLSEKVKERRIALGLTQAQVASRAGIEQSLVSKLERALDTRLSTLTKVLVALDLEIELRPRPRAGEIGPGTLLERLGTGKVFTPQPGTLLERFGIPDDEREEKSTRGRSRRKG